MAEPLSFQQFGAPYYASGRRKWYDLFGQDPYQKYIADYERRYSQQYDAPYSQSRVTGTQGSAQGSNNILGLASKIMKNTSLLSDLATNLGFGAGAGPGAVGANVSHNLGVAPVVGGPHSAYGSGASYAGGPAGAAGASAAVGALGSAAAAAFLHAVFSPSMPTGPLPYAINYLPPTEQGGVLGYPVNIARSGYFEPTNDPDLFGNVNKLNKGVGAESLTELGVPGNVNYDPERYNWYENPAYDPSSNAWSTSMFYNLGEDKYYTPGQKEVMHSPTWYDSP